MIRIYRSTMVYLIAACLLLAMPLGGISAPQTQPSAHDAAQRWQQQSYAVSLPKGWDKYLSVGSLIIASPPFYAPNAFVGGTWPQVMCYWSLKNLTAAPLYLEVNYRSVYYLDSPGGAGISIGYLLRPHESRKICTTAYLASAVEPANLRIRFEELRLPKQQLLGGSYYGMMTENLVLSPSVPCDIMVENKYMDCPRVTGLRQARSAKGEYFLEISIHNLGKKDARLVIQTSVSDPSLILGSFTEKVIMVNGRKTVTVQVPYSFPTDPGDNPLLTWRVAEVPDPGDTAAIELSKDNLSYLSRTGNVLAAGSIDLLAAAEKGLVMLPPYKHVPVEERAKLTEQKQSEHFLFRYRPDSFVARYIEQIVKDREEAYRKLKGLLHMDLPAMITIDLYPDLTAKGLGSGTPWVAANTVTSTLIAEVCNESCCIDPNHELAHIFTDHFGGGGGELAEPFAVYCQADFDIAQAMKLAWQKLDQGKLSSLEGILLTTKASQADTIVFIHFLIKLDLEKFKRFYVSMAKTTTREELDKVLLEMYETDLPGMERQWHTYLSQESN